MVMAETYTLNSGYEMPVLGYGTWQLPKNIAAERVRDALECGYRHIDNAPSFRNQAEVAAGIKEWCKIRKIRREELFLSSKIWNTHHSRDRCMEQIESMLEDFGTTYMDLIVIHWPFGWAEDEPVTEKSDMGMWPRCNNGKFRYSDIDYMETWTALEDAHRSGKIRSIGLANFNLEQVERVWTKGLIKPAVLQVELNPLFTQKESVVQTLIRWIIDIGHTAIVKSSETRRARNNLNVFKFRLTAEEIQRIENLNQDFRILNPLLGNHDHPYFPWPHKKAD
ncbi:hypothetical protein CAEBREN_12392 [Caenorhabditis brenneri]|uniref:NADP-dependent oxidoreductase domain-containing protein n=1 Tax=Caenorhabditis brenneri TaxID=135651 RepID=G0PFR6_CAEBE|nr:hypothetical protein CAEBREN_12392 [Caenorhabditis brenneri]